MAIDENDNSATTYRNIKIFPKTLLDKINVYTRIKLSSWIIYSLQLLFVGLIFIFWHLQGF